MTSRAFDIVRYMNVQADRTAVDKDLLSVPTAKPIMDFLYHYSEEMLTL